MADARLIDVSMTVNGETVTRRIEPRMTLVDFLRYELELTGSHVGCEHGVCGACTVRLDGAIVRGCLLFAAQAEGAEVVTIEGVTGTGEVADLQTEFQERTAVQCGFCTPGMIMAAAELLAEGGALGREEIREYMSGNYCRCTGYQAIVDAVESVADKRAGGGE